MTSGEGLLSLALNDGMQYCAWTLLAAWNGNGMMDMIGCTIWRWLF